MQCVSFFVRCVYSEVQKFENLDAIFWFGQAFFKVKKIIKWKVLPRNFLSIAFSIVQKWMILTELVFETTFATSRLCPKVIECQNGAQLFFILLNSRKMTEKNAIDFSVALFYYVLLLLQTFSNVIFSQSCLQFLQISSLENVGFEISPFHSSRNSIPLRKKTGKTTVSLCCTKRKQMRENKMFSKDNFTNNYLMPIKKYFKVQIRIFFSSSIILLAFFI